jgi:hypothetical protein
VAGNSHHLYRSTGTRARRTIGGGIRLRVNRGLILGADEARNQPPQVSPPVASAFRSPGARSRTNRYQASSAADAPGRELGKLPHSLVDDSCRSVPAGHCRGDVSGDCCRVCRWSSCCGPRHPRSTPGTRAGHTQVAGSRIAPVVSDRCARWRQRACALRRSGAGLSRNAVWRSRPARAAAPAGRLRRRAAVGWPDHTADAPSPTPRITSSWSRRAVQSHCGRRGRHLQLDAASSGGPAIPWPAGWISSAIRARSSLVGAPSVVSRAFLLHAARDRKCPDGACPAGRAIADAPGATSPRRTRRDRAGALLRQARLDSGWPLARCAPACPR